MRNFIKKALYFSTTFLLIICVSGSDFKKHENIPDYMDAINIKHNRLKVFFGKRMIFAGGSNLAFGIDSNKIENELKVPVINLGLHAGLGLEFIINELKSIVRKDDIVILSNEYYLEINGDYELKKHTGKIFPEAQNYFNYDLIEELIVFFKSKKKNLKHNIKLLFKITDNTNEKFTGKEPSIYSKDSFDAHGDMIGHLNKKYEDKLKDRRKIRYRSYEGIEILNNFYNFAQAKYIKVYFLFPNYPQSEYLNNKDTIEKYYLYILKNLKIPLINNPKDFVFDDSMFFDTIYHLNNEGRKIRTEKILEILKRLDL